MTLAGRGVAHASRTPAQEGVVQVDGSPAVGGEGLGARPMEIVLVGLGGCSGIDVVSILKKQRQVLRDLTITVEGDRAENETPAVFRRIRVHFDAHGDLDPVQVRRAVELSMEKYCSVARMLESTAAISHTFSVNGALQQEDALPGRS